MSGTRIEFSGPLTLWGSPEATALKGPSYAWTELYQAVPFELDLNKNKEAVQKAEIALRQRAEHLRQESNVDPHELDAVSQALSALEFLKTKQGQR